MLTYEQKLDENLRWALDEGSRHFMNESDVHKTLQRITRKLDELGIPYAVVGAIALFFHGLRRFTEDVGILVTAEGLKRIHDELEGLGYIPVFEGSKNLRDATTGVRVEFLVAGQFPGDGKPKPVAFPNPEDASVLIDGISCIGLEKLIELKILSGTTGDRLWDLGDIQKLIRRLGLSRDFADALDPSVRDDYLNLWDRAQKLREQEDE